ncbi:MAG: rifampicin phosphotransferase, partial [Baekduia sp.]|nr:rifampicin phosphotransferase [Baekduia sp.]
QAGGKAANLGELTRAGLPVPPGFVITTQAYREFVRRLDVGDLIIERAAGATEVERATTAAEQIQHFFRGDLAHDLHAAIAGAYAGSSSNRRRHATAAAPASTPPVSRFSNAPRRTTRNIRYGSSSSIAPGRYRPPPRVRGLPHPPL